MVEIGCPTHIMYNCIQTARNILSFDTETIQVSIFNYLSIYSVYYIL